MNFVSARSWADSLIIFCPVCHEHRTICSLMQRSFCVCTQPMRDGVTLWRRLLFAGRIHTIPTDVYVPVSIHEYFQFLWIQHQTSISLFYTCYCNRHTNDMNLSTTNCYSRAAIPAPPPRWQLQSISRGSSMVSWVAWAIQRLRPTSSTSSTRASSTSSHSRKCPRKPCQVYQLHSFICVLWRHQMETFSALLSLCVGSPLVTGGFPSQRDSNADLWYFCAVSLNILLKKHSIDR